MKHSFAVASFNDPYVVRSRFSPTGFPIKDARFSKLKSILDLLSDDKEDKIKENID